MRRGGWKEEDGEKRKEKGRRMRSIASFIN